MYSGLGDLPKCKKIFEELKERKEGVPLKAYHYLLEASIHGGDVELGESLTLELEAMGLVLQAQNYRIRLYGHNRIFEKMFQVYSQMLEKQKISRQIETDASTFASLFEVCVANGKLSEALSIGSQAAQQFLVGELELVNSVLSAFPQAVVEQREEELLAMAAELNFPKAVESLLESQKGGKSGMALRTPKSDQEFQSFKAFCSSMGKGPEAPSLENQREFFNRMVDALWAQGKESLAIEVAIVGAEKGMYLNLVSKEEFPGDVSLLSLNLRTVSQSVAQIALFVWIGIQLRQVREKAPDLSKTTFAILFGKGLSKGDLAVREVVALQLEDLGSPFVWDDLGDSLVAVGREMEDWLGRSELSRMLIVKNGRLKGSGPNSLDVGLKEQAGQPSSANSVL